MYSLPEQAVWSGGGSCRRLVERGHEVVATARTPEKVDAPAGPRRGGGRDGRPRRGLCRRGGRPGRARGGRPPDDGARRDVATCAGSTRSSRSRTSCGRAALDHLLTASEAVGVRRFVAQSYTGWPNERVGGPVKTESDPLDPDPPAQQRRSIEAIGYLERAVTSAAPIEGVVLRYGSLYGPGTSMANEYADLIRARKLPLVGDGAGVWSFIHADDAADGCGRRGRGGSPGRLQHRRRRAGARRRVAAVPGRVPGRPAAAARAGLDRPFRDRRGRRLDDDADSRRVECQGQARARLGARMAELARGVRRRGSTTSRCVPRPSVGNDAHDRVQPEAAPGGRV